ncbi:MAG: hypothetical protein H6738_19110 [Alphaproteobacteria bacterium]|nr:hypothetical protein [Alphaproteobacteria bacterium]MCB9698899.1 hypothetical protein [Alphaproteobacteria bacterium]
MDRPPPADGIVWTHRAVLLLAAVVLPPLGWMSWTHRTAFDPMVARLLLSALTASTALATFVWPWARVRSRELLGSVMSVVFVWFLYAAMRNGLTQDDAIGLMPLACVAPMVVRSWTELAAALALVVAGILFLHANIPEPQFPIPVLSLLLSSVTLGIGISSMTRERLADRLQEANETLEQRVEQRTEELAASLARAEAEAQERARAEREAVHASRAKSVFLANMSHELRTPLNAIIGYTQLVSEELDDRPELLADLERVERSATHLVGLINDLLDLSRIEADELELELGPQPLDEVVGAAVSMLPSLRRPERGLVVEDTGLSVVADRTRLRQVLVNLLSNADKFTPTGHIAVAARRDGDRVVIEVEDTGTGIAPELLPRVFDRFVMGDASSTRRQGGTGLGLAISRELVERMGGRLDVSSQVGRGTTFQISMLSGSPPG